MGILRTAVAPSSLVHSSSIHLGVEASMNTSVPSVHEDKRPQALVAVCVVDDHLAVIARAAAAEFATGICSAAAMQAAVASRCGPTHVLGIVLLRDC